MGNTARVGRRPHTGRAGAGIAPAPLGGGAPGGTAPPVLGGLPFVVLMTLPVLLVAYGTLESLLWADRLWGAHFYAFYRPAILAIAASLALAAIAAAWFLPARGSDRS